MDQEQIDQRIADFVAGRKALFVPEPSCGAEVAAVCDSIWLGPTAIDDGNANAATVPVMSAT